MALQLLHLFITLCAATSVTVATTSSNMFPMSCTTGVANPPCWATLYHSNNLGGSNLKQSQIAAFYSVSTSQIRPITSKNNLDFLVTVPCYCQDVNHTDGYFYDAPYTVQESDTFSGVSESIYSGQAWDDGSEERSFIKGRVVTMNLLCGCDPSELKTEVTYTVQQGDTLLSIAELLSSTPQEIQNLNKRLIQDPHFIDVGWVLFVPSNL